MNDTILSLKDKLSELDNPEGKFNLLEIQREKEVIKAKIRTLREKFLTYGEFASQQDLDKYIENVSSTIIHAYVDDKNNCIKGIFYKGCDFETAVYIYWSAKVETKQSHVEVYLDKRYLGKFIGRKGFNINYISKSHKLQIKAVYKPEHDTEFDEVEADGRASS